MTNTTQKSRQEKLPGGGQVVADTDCEAAIINMLKELKETILKELKEGMMTMFHQMENTNQKTEMREKTKRKLWN